MSVNVAQFIEYLPSMHEALDLITKLCMLVHI